MKTIIQRIMKRNSIIILSLISFVLFCSPVYAKTTSQVSITAIADSYINGGDHADTNFGTEQLIVKQSLSGDGKLTHLFFATMDGPGGFNNSTKSWNMVLPLKDD